MISSFSNFFVSVSFLNNLSCVSDTLSFSFSSLLRLSSLPVSCYFYLYRLLGLKDGTKLGFWRHVGGNNDKWIILKANNANLLSNPLTSSNVSGVLPHTSLIMEDSSARGKYVRIGDTILIETLKSKHVLALMEGTTSMTGGGMDGRNSSSSSGNEIRLIMKDHTGLGSEVWQLEVFATVPLPTWCQTRPYLR
jgi:hypothetical protein